MNRAISIFVAFLTVVSCMDLEQISSERNNPYQSDLHNVSIRLQSPSALADVRMDGIIVYINNVLNGSRFEGRTDAEGKVVFSLPNGLYSVSTSHAFNDELYSASEDRVRVADADRSVSMLLNKVRTGDILIKEIYCGGCKKTPEEGNYQSDKYIVLHNNTSGVVWLDGLCFGMSDPYNATGTNVWIKKDPATGATIFPSFVPLVEAVWQIGGDGDDFPLASGEDAVLVINGAIDHSQQYPLSVNLNHQDYFVCYNTTYFPNLTYHPVPGDKIRQERILNVVIKIGQANAFPLSISSPAPVIFRPEGTTIQEHIAQADNVIPIPGSSNGHRAVCIPYDWVEDAVDVFDGRSSNNVKRFSSAIDGGCVYQSDVYMGHSLMRKINEGKSAALGYEVLVDTNNSSNDLYERDVQSLHVEKEGGDE